MAPSKSSRKGKKAWRKNIDTQQVEDGLEQHTTQQRQGPAVDSLPDEQLFFVDKARDDSTAAAVANRLKRKREREQKPLKCQSILAAAQQARPVLSPALPPCNKKARHSKLVSGLQPRQPADVANKAGPAIYDVWTEEPAPAQPAVQQPIANPFQRKAAARRAAAARAASRIKALEVDAPGCSYNPDAEQHQEAVAEAVAAEMSKLYKRELEAEAPPAFVDYQPETDEMALLQTLEEGAGEEGEEGDGDDAVPGEAAARRADKKNKAMRNKEARRRAAEVAEEERRRLKRQRQDLANLHQLDADISSAETARQARLARRAVVKAERMASEPPRLGKQRFNAEPVQVLLSDEISGSLRKLKPAAALARDRFKSLQKRGVIEPRMPSKHKQGRVISFMTGDRAERAQAGHAALRDLQRSAKQK